jgi:hypothetical protein
MIGRRQEAAILRETLIGPRDRQLLDIARHVERHSQKQRFPRFGTKETGNFSIVMTQGLRSVQTSIPHSLIPIV